MNLSQSITYFQNEGSLTACYLLFYKETQGD